MCVDSSGPEIKQKNNLRWELVLSHTHIHTMIVKHTHRHTHTCRAWLAERRWVGHSWTSQLDLSTRRGHTVSACVWACIYCAQRDESFLSLFSSSDHPTATLHTPPSPKLFSLPCRTESLFKNCHPVSSLSLCVFFHCLIHFRSLTHAHTHIFSLTSILRQFI